MNADCFCIASINMHPAADCERPMGDDISYNSTLEGSPLTVWCPNNYTFTAVCHRNGSWIPDPGVDLCSRPTGILNCKPNYSML